MGGKPVKSCYMVQAALENELREFSVLDQAERNEVLSLLSELLPYREALEALDSFAALENELREFSVLDQAERNEVLSLLSELLPYREALEALDSFVSVPH
ncbi:UNVERIFIED_CONTAM: hypothetical protein FKN15_051612 [Acipenser sinensis]